MSANLSIMLSFLSDLVRYQLAVHFGHQLPAPQVPAMQSDDAPITRFIQQRRMTVDEYVALAVGLAPHVQPHLFDTIIQEFLPQGGDFPAIGGVKGTNQRSFIPTGETVIFLLAGNDLSRRLEIQRIFGSNHYFSKEKILYLEEMKPGEPMTSGRLILDPEYVDLFTLGYVTPPRANSNFPANLIQTELDWNDLILNPQTMGQLRELEIWVQHNDTLLYDWKMYRKLKPGFRALFYGPPGTGKTMAAGLLGKYTGHDVYRVDLSMMVSKYIGETEKNLATLFDKAENKRWILFFDEADALFGKRTNVQNSHDRYANQEVSYLLQRVEEFPGLSILASNFKSNLDDAFTRRFQTIVYFPMPKSAERLALWQQSFPSATQLDGGINLKQIADKFELSGSNIVNVVHYCCLQALSNNTNVITYDSLITGINREFVKENKVFSNS
jgi:hypothetical protein